MWVSDQLGQWLRSNHQTEPLHPRYTLETEQSAKCRYLSIKRCPGAHTLGAVTSGCDFHEWLAVENRSSDKVNYSKDLSLFSTFPTGHGAGRRVCFHPYRHSCEFSICREWGDHHEGKKLPGGASKGRHMQLLKPYRSS